MDRWKAEQGRGREKRKIRRKKSRRERVRRKKMQMRERVGKSRNTVFFQWFVAKAAGAEPSGQMRDEKLHAVVARSTFPSQNVQNTPASDHFWKLRCRKSARRCGAKHISKSKCTKHTSFGPLLEVAMSKAYFQVKSARKNWRVRSTFGRSDVVSRGRRKGLWTLSKVSKTWGFCSIFNYNHHYITLHSNTVHYTTTTTTPSLHSTTLHSTTLHYTQLHSITLHYTTLHYTTLHYITLHYVTLHYTTLHYTPHYLPLHYITLHYTPLHYTSLHYTTLHSTTLELHYTTFHYTPLQYIQLHYTTLHSATFHYTT